MTDGAVAIDPAEQLKASLWQEPNDPAAVGTALLAFNRPQDLERFLNGWLSRLPESQRVQAQERLTDALASTPLEQAGNRAAKRARTAVQDTLRSQQTGQGLPRRTFLQGAGLTIAAGFLPGLLGGDAPRASAAQKPNPQLTAGEVHNLTQQPLMPEILEGVLAFSYADGMTSLAREKDSATTVLSSYITNTLGLSHKEGFQHSIKSFTGKAEDSTAFPHANLVLNLMINALFTSGFYGPQVQSRALKELASTIAATTFLSEKGLLGKGIDLNPIALNHIIQNPDGSDRALSDPEGLIGDALFQLCVGAVPNQPWLYAFGNSHVAAGLQPHIERAVKLGLFGLYPDGAEAEEAKQKNRFVMDTTSVKTIRASLKKIDNPEVEKRTLEYLEKLEKAQAELATLRTSLEGCTDEKIRQKTLQTIQALEKKGPADSRPLKQKIEEDVAQEMVLDGAMGIMGTAINSAQTWMGDLGPFVGTIMKHGPTNGVAIATAHLPYALIDGMIHAVLTARRFGISANKVANKKNVDFQTEFSLTNLAQLVNTLNIPNWGGTKEKIAQHPKLDYSILSSLKNGNRKIAHTAVEAVKIMAGKDESLNRDAVKQKFDELVENLKTQGPEGEGADLSSNTDALDSKTKKMLQEIERRVLAEAGTETQDTAQAEMDDFIRNSKAMAQDFDTWLTENHKPKNAGQLKVQDFLNFLGANGQKKWYEGLMYQHWDDRIGTDFASLLYFVSFQGTSLTGLIPTLNRLVYDTPQFNQLPLPLKELISVEIHRTLSGQADNWADNQAGNDNHTVMYSNQVYKDHLADISQRYFGDSKILWNDFMQDNDPSYFTVDQYKGLVERILILFDTLIGESKSVSGHKNPNALSIKQLQQVRQQTLSDLDSYYWRGAGLAHASSVGGGGDTTAGNAPNYGYAVAAKLSYGRSLMDMFRYFRTYLLRTAEIYGGGVQTAKWLTPHLANALAEILPWDAFSPLTYAQDIQQAIDNHSLPGYAEKREQLLSLLH